MTRMNTLRSGALSAVILMVAGAGTLGATARDEGTGMGFRLTSPAVADGGALPVEYTGDGESATLPLAWSGEPAGTRAFALVMHHVDPQGIAKWYWTLWNLPPDVHALAKNSVGIGTVGTNSVNHQLGYAPPHSAGPGPKTYVYTLYALSAMLELPVPPAEVTLDLLNAAMKGVVLGRADLSVVYTRTGIGPVARPGADEVPPGPSSAAP